VVADGPRVDGASHGFRSRAGAVKPLAWARHRVKRWLGDERLGMVDYWCRPGWREPWGGPFNGQAFRQRLVAELCARVAFAAVVETGTYRGSTTAYLRRVTRLPVHSFEVTLRDHGFARARLWRAHGVHLHWGDSRTGITALAASSARPDGSVFFYLDAHWGNDVPLREEVALAFRHWDQAVVLIDDFAVPDDPGYGFDDAGQGLTLAHLGPWASPPTAVWFPACASSAETGARRGCVVLARDSELIWQIDAMRTLRRWEPAPP
jgi:hypothetical protein